MLRREGGAACFAGMAARHRRPAGLALGSVREAVAAVRERGCVTPRRLR